ncbi:MAG: citrate/2-methylcitrate synthase [Eubacteriales bacterium]|nr:citrate/2-methylcitrate synthase [Eubacteriales bacterium]
MYDNKTKDFISAQVKKCETSDRIPLELYEQFEVKRGLRDKNGVGVRAGLTSISSIEAYKDVNGEKVPCDGKLCYRGYNVFDIVNDARADGRFIFEETAYLLLFGELPTDKQLDEFRSVLGSMRTLPTNFTRDVVMKASSKDIMNTLTRSILTLGSYDEEQDNLEIENVMRQCLMLISVLPMIAVYGYHAYNHYELDQSMYIHRPDPNLSTAENLLMMLRPDKKYTELEAKVLDMALMLHMEHGGGNNSSFTTHVVSSAGSDTYSVIAAALCSLKGPKHGGANIKVVDMMNDLKNNVKDTTDISELRNYIGKLLDKEAFDKRGLVYGMGHAVYSISDPRAVIFKGFAEVLAREKGMDAEFELYENVEKLAVEVIAEKRRIYKGVSANVDFYSGLVYSMLGIPDELYTPMFAIARVVGWSAHRIEELVSGDKIIRPAYMSISADKNYKNMKDR